MQTEKCKIKNAKLAGKRNLSLAEHAGIAEEKMNGGFSFQASGVRFSTSNE